MSVRLPVLRERMNQPYDYGSPYYDNTVDHAVRMIASYEATSMVRSERSFRYPWTVRSVEQLEEEMIAAQSCHGRLGACGWHCAWLPDPRRVVWWDEACQIVEDWRRAEYQKTKNTK